MIVSTIIQGSPEYCYLMEEKLRPIPNIGYNISAGGSSTNLGSRHSRESKEKMSKALKGRVVIGESLENMRKAAKDRGFKHSDETKKYLSDLFKNRTPNPEAIKRAAEVNRAKQSWENPASNKDVWLKAETIFCYMRDNPEHGTRRISKVFGVQSSQLLVMHKKIKSGWIPSLDTDWLIFSSKLTPEVSGNKSL